MSSRSDPDQWRQVQAEIDVLLALPPGGRAQRLAEITAQSPQLAAELAELLAQAESPALPEALPPTALAAFDEDCRVGQRIGAFAIDERLGEGGNGVVYRAHRVGEYAQTVAIKLLRGARMDAAGARRLEHERDILAQLDHPGIVRLVDAGVADDGRPYLALEFVAGQTLDAWLSSARPDILKRLSIFARVCDAVAYAHQRLLVHRDIKPGNLMIGADGTPKLLDYGIARLLDEGAASTLTRDYGSSLTPAYAAPEQLRAEPATTATDVHGLGIMLFEMLCGTHPFLRDGCHGESLRQALMHTDAPSILREPGLLAMPRAWRTDLDRIVAMALAKDPGRRHASARELADDVRAVLAGRPVRARRATAGYVLRRFAGRNRVAVALVGASLLGLVCASALALWHARQADEERALAERRFAQVHAFANTVLFDYTEGIAALAGSLPVQRRLVADSLRYLETLRQEVGDDMGLVRDLVAAYLKVGDLQGNPYGPNLGDLAGAAISYGHAERQLQRLEQLHDASDAWRLLRARLHARQAELKHQAGELAVARALFEQSLAEFAALPEALQAQVDVVVERSQVLDHHGDLLGREGAASLNQTEAASAQWTQARALRDAALRLHPQDPRLRFGRYQSELREAEQAIGQGEMDKAEAALGIAEASISALVQAHPDNSIYRYEQALVYSRQVPVHEALGRLDASVDAALRAFTSTEQMLARDPGNSMLWQAVAASAGWAARQLLKANRPAEAVPVVARQIEVNRLWVDAAKDNPEARFSLSLAHRRQGELREAMGDHAGAIASHREALALQSTLVAVSPDFALGHALSQRHLGRNLAAVGELLQAREALHSAATAIAVLVQADPELAGYRDHLAETWAQLAEACWRTPADPAQAREAAQAALSAWDELARDEALSVPAAARRDAIRERLQKE
ncbi:MAG: protein kinase [Xanthomonadales bacterium]|nr:Serine/threonine-protein kinase PknD [Xanthomonadales bacterium]MCC6594733.1 protein kinase [Xanthomonadales bacterium]MCE7932139.1 hypothetical protein [Xanthomonadales bacterium PRO6]